jgi:uncharacterized protein (DUF58 family)
MSQTPPTTSATSPTGNADSAGKIGEPLRASGAAGASKLMDPKILMRIKNLQLRAKVVVEGMWHGLHRSPYHGFSSEFTEYRQYTPGDDLRYLDWKLLARSDRYFCKRYEDETSLRCHVLADNSKSMGFGSLEYTKAQYAGTLAATLAYFLNSQRDAVGLVTFDQQIRDYLPARFRPGHLHRIMVALQTPPQGKSTDVIAPLERIAQIVHKRGLMVLISDLLAPIDQLETNLSYLRSRGHEVFVFQVLDPMELSLRFEQPALFEDMESGKDIYVDPELVRKAYREGLDAHIERIRQACETLGVEYRQLTTDQPLELALFEFLSSRMEEGRHVMRSSSRSAGAGSSK